MKNFDFYRPTTPDEALDVLDKVKDAEPKAGGTDLLTLLKDHIVEPSAIVDLARVPGMAGIETADDGSIRIGAMTTLKDLGENPLVLRTAHAIAHSGGTAATPLVRTRATVGGNLCQRPRCWYFRHEDYDCAKKGGDTCFAQNGENKYHAIFANGGCAIVAPSNMAPALIAHDATIHVQHEKRARQVPAAEFWVKDASDLNRENVLEQDELIVGVSYQPRPGGSAYVEVKEKQSYDWAMASCAVRIEVEGKRIKDVRVVLQHVAPMPMRREDAEAIVKGKALTEKLALAAGDEAAEGATPLRDNGYKVQLVRACVADALMQAYARATEGQ